jgi:subtilisin-like proprotein convertase family protein
LRDIPKRLDVSPLPLCWVCFLIGAVHGVWGAPLTFSNTNFINLNENPSPPTPATPYPSTNLINGFSGQVVQKVTVTLQGFSHSFPSDATILLVGPHGQKCVLMANAGGQDKLSVTNLTLTLDDDATSPVPVFTSLTNGVFKPANGYLSFGYSGLPSDLPPPAPLGNSNAPSALSVFKNTDPDGTWDLFIVDDAAGDSGSIANGWSLNLTLAVPLQISRSGTNVVVSWPGSATNCTLQSVTTVSANGWSNVLTEPTLGAGRFNLTNPTSPESGFYRLIRN